MAVSVEDVLAVLWRSGRPVTERALRDWVEKGLLPPRRRVGRGRGQGVAWVWTDRAIVRQAAIVDDLLTWHGRVATAGLPLWVLGYDVPVEAVRGQLLAFLNGFLSALTGNAVDEEEVRDWTYDFAARMVRARSVRLPSEMTEALLAIFLDAWVNRVSAPDQQPLDYVIEDWRAFVSGNMAQSGSADLRADGRNPGDVAEVQNVLQRVSLPRLREAVTTASPAAFQEVQQILSRGLEVVLQLVRTTPEMHAATRDLITAPWSLLTLLGSHGGPLLLLAVQEEPTWHDAVVSILAKIKMEGVHSR